MPTSYEARRKAATYTPLGALSLEGKSEWQALKVIRIPVPVFVLVHKTQNNLRTVLGITSLPCTFAPCGSKFPEL